MCPNMTTYFTFSTVCCFVTGILIGGLDDFDTVDDLHDAIGDVLLELDPDKTKDDVLQICGRLFYVMKQ